MFAIKQLTPYLLIFITCGCASISPPEGGEKDIKAPELVSSSPANKSLNASGRVITLTFNEDVRLKDFNRQLIVTPNTGNTIKSEADRNKVKLEFEKNFQPNTTYFLNFREGIEDITEANKPQNLALTFSTGTYLDSGQVKGNIRDLLTSAPEKDINVVLYSANDTTTIRKNKPYYLTKTAENGDYLLQNIKNGRYYLYAHQDKNNDNIYNDEREKIGYLTEAITIDHKTPDQDIQTVRIDTKAPYIATRQSYIDEYHLNYNEGIIAVKIAGGTAGDLVSMVDKNPKTVRLFPNTAQTKGRYIITAIDSSNNAKTDTLQLTFEGKKARRDAGFKTVNKNTKFKTNENIQLQFDVPLKLTNGPLFTIIEDTVTKRVLNYPQDVKLNETNTILSFDLNTKAKNNVELISDTTRLLPVSGDRLKKQSVKYSITDKEQGGSLDIKITTTYKSYILEVLDREYKVQQTYVSPKSFRVENLFPNTYRLRVKIDEDGNGVWRAGNKDLKTIPEKIYNYTAPIEVRANWEQGVELNF
jgi:hypothetical protein